jgi:hypothetical protein
VFISTLLLPEIVDDPTVLPVPTPLNSCVQVASVDHSCFRSCYCTPLILWITASPADRQAGATTEPRPARGLWLRLCARPLVRTQALEASLGQETHNTGGRSDGISGLILRHPKPAPKRLANKPLKQLTNG